MAQTIATSKQFTLNLNDLWKGFLVSVITPVITIIISSLNAGSLTFDWKVIGITALTAALAYLVKNFLTPSAIVMKDAPAASVESVKDGTAEIKVVNK